MGVTKGDTRSLDYGSYAESLQATIPYSLMRRMSSTCFAFVAYYKPPSKQLYKKWKVPGPGQMSCTKYPNSLDHAALPKASQAALIGESGGLSQWILVYTYIYIYISIDIGILSRCTAICSLYKDIYIYKISIYIYIRVHPNKHVTNPFTPNRELRKRSP